MSLLSFEPFFRDDIYACIYHFRIRLPKTCCISASYADLSLSKNFFSRHLSPDKTRKSHLDYGLQLTGVDKKLKARVLGDILEPEFNEEQPKRLLPRVWFRYRRWQANGWKQRLCYNESRWSAFWSGVWNHLLKPSSI